MRLRFGIFATLVALVASVSVACTSNSSISSNGDNTKILISKVVSSTTGITISWTDDSGESSDYTVSVYNDQECKNLYQEYSITCKDRNNKRFSVPYLDSENIYYICVANKLGYKSKPFEVVLESKIIRRNILSQNFDNLFWGYDYINSAQGVKLAGDPSPRTYIVENLSDTIADSEPAANIDDDGRLLFQYHASMLKLMGFEGWPTTSKNIRILPGYVKLGTAFQDGILHTPAFAALEDATETIDVSFSAAIFSSTLQANGGKITASILRGDNSVLHTKDFNMKSVDGKPSWNNFKFTVEGVTADCYLEIKTTSQAKQVCVDNIKIVRNLYIPEGYIYGYVSDKANGNPIKDVAISDGFTVVTTDQDGLYKLEPHQDAMYVYYSVPAEYEVIKSVTGPRFYTKLESDVKEYDFELTKLPNGKEEKFALFALGDTQVSNSTKLARFQNEAIPAINVHSKSLNIPCYGITLGDVVSTSSSTNTVTLMEPMREAMRSRYSGMAIFQVMGNHDCIQFNKDNPLSEEPDHNGSNFQIKAQRAFEKVFGPINYSFNRGNVHIIGMRDIVYLANNDCGDYTAGFTAEQFEWLKQDLALVPKENMVVLCVHIPLHGYAEVSTHYVKQVHELLNEYAEAHIISGHMHINYNYEHSKYKIYEHNSGTVCGCWWLSNVCGDGTPNGYGVYIGQNNTFSDWYYIGYAEGMNTREHQMRLYRGNAITGTERISKRKYSGYYSFNFGEDILLANVYNADNSWKIEVYEDGVYTGDMKLIADKSVDFTKKLVGNYTMEDPRRITDDIEAPYEMWVTGVHLSLNDNYESNRGWSRCKHLYKYQLQDPDVQNIKVIAIDRFGNRYEETKLTDYRDYSIALQP